GFSAVGVGKRPAEFNNTVAYNKRGQRCPAFLVRFLGVNLAVFALAFSQQERLGACSQGNIIGRQTGAYGHTCRNAAPFICHDECNLGRAVAEIQFCERVPGWGARSLVFSKIAVSGHQAKASTISVRSFSHADWSSFSSSYSAYRPVPSAFHPRSAISCAARAASWSAATPPNV